ncbi:MAG: vWA domain-containing protein [Gemmobacter sp.]
MSFRNIVAGAVVAFGMTMGSSSFAATIVNLGFAIDHSGSIVDNINRPDFTRQKQGLANALALIPTDNPDVQYRVGVISFGGSVHTLAGPTLINSAADITTIQEAITSFNRSSPGVNTSWTYTGDAINALTGMFSDIDSTLTLFNLSTDGSPNGPNNWEAASANAFAAGVDSISFEMIGSFGQAQINTMLDLAGPDAIHITDAADLPNATEQGFVFEVASFEDYEAAIAAKIGQIVEDTGGGTTPIPLPASLPLLLAGLGLVGGLRLRRKHAA